MNKEQAVVCIVVVSGIFFIYFSFQTNKIVVQNKLYYIYMHNKNITRPIHYVVTHIDNESDRLQMLLPKKKKTVYAHKDTMQGHKSV